MGEHVTVWLCTDGEDVPVPVLDRLASRMPASRRARWERMRHPVGARNLVLGYWLVRAGMRESGRDAPEWSIGPCGKPTGGTGHFSLTHTEKLQACAVSPRPVGIDAERVAGDLRSVLPVVMTLQEQALIAGARDPRAQATLLWTRKESLVKREGSGIGESIARLDVTVPPPGLRWSSWRLADHWLTVCVAESDPVGEPRALSAQELISMAEGMIDDRPGGRRHGRRG